MNAISLYIHTFDLCVHLLMDFRWIPCFGSYEKSYYKHLCADVCLSPATISFGQRFSVFIITRVILCSNLLGTAFLCSNETMEGSGREKFGNLSSHLYNFQVLYYLYFTVFVW